VILCVLYLSSVKNLPPAREGKPSKSLDFLFICEKASNMNGISHLLALVISGLVFLSPLCPGETVKDREGAIRADKAKMEKSDRWVYNDVESGFSEAKKSGKPLMVVLRCVPCLACMGMDTGVLLENPKSLPAP
jgi:hypothetical protein